MDDEVKYAFSSDMMSDVLAYADEHSASIAGLCNPQVVRGSAEMLDIVCIIFVRNKIPGSGASWRLRKKRELSSYARREACLRLAAYYTAMDCLEVQIFNG